MSVLSGLWPVFSSLFFLMGRSQSGISIISFSFALAEASVDVATLFMIDVKG